MGVVGEWDTLEFPEGVGIMANIYDDYKFDTVQNLVEVKNQIGITLCALKIIEEKLRDDVACECDFDFIKIAVTQEKVVYDIYIHKLTFDEVKCRFPRAEIFKWVDDYEGPYYGSKYYVVRCRM